MSKTIVQKLMLKPGQRLQVIDPPNGFLALLGDLPPEVTLVAPTAKEADAIQIFVASLYDLRKLLPEIKTRLSRDGILWVSYPKGMGKKPGGISRDVIREFAPSIGLKAVSLFSVDSTWSAMRLKIVSSD